MNTAINSELLQKKIRESGFKLGYISSELNLSPYGFNRKLRNESEFKVSEMFKLCEILKLSDKERTDIFLPSE